MPNIRLAPDVNKKNQGQIEQAQDEPQWIVTQRLLSALTIPGFR